MGKFTHPYFSTPRELHFLVVSENFTRSKRIRHEKCLVLARPREILFLGLAKTQGNFFPRSWQDPGKAFPWGLVKIFLILTFFDIHFKPIIQHRNKCYQNEIECVLLFLLRKPFQKGLTDP